MTGEKEEILDAAGVEGCTLSIRTVTFGTVAVIASSLTNEGDDVPATGKLDLFSHLF